MRIARCTPIVASAFVRAAAYFADVDAVTYVGPQFETVLRVLSDVRGVVMIHD